MNYDITRPWLTLDKWQKEYITTDGNKDCFLLCGRQVGKTTAMSIKAVKLCLKSFKRGEFVLICSITEKQAYHMLAKALSYAETNYPTRIITKGKEKATKHKIMFKNGTGILCHAAGETGEGLRGFTIKKLMIDEGSRMSEEFFIAVQPMLSIVKGSMDIASTPFGKLHDDGTEKFFYKCSKDPKYKQFYVSSEDCPRHTKEFLQTQKKRMTKLSYAQEYLAVFTDELKRLFTDELINQTCVLKKEIKSKNQRSKFYLGVDVAGFGSDECTYEIIEKLQNKILIQRENIVERKNKTTETTRTILKLENEWNFRKIGIDDGGVGFGVFSELLENKKTRRKTEALNNASRSLDKEDKKKKKLLKEEMYINLMVLMENNQIKLLDDDEVKASLASIQSDEGKIFGGNSHITEGIIRAVWEATKDKTLNIMAFC